MPCCKAEEFEWCRDLDVIYSYTEGMSYCVFHALAEQKGMSVEEFNKLVFERIDKAIRKRQPCNLSGAVFPGDISFYDYRKARSLPPIVFSYTIFLGEVFFREVVFSGIAKFYEASFLGVANFTEAVFSKDVFFHMASFSRRAYFIEAAISGDANFNETDFREGADFSRTAFNGDASFCVASFRGDTSFYMAAFSRGASFNEAAFCRAARFYETSFNNLTSFYSADFYGLANFHRASFKDFGDFKSAKFKACATFLGARCKDLEFTEASFSRHARFDDIAVEKRLLFKNIPNPGNLYLPIIDLEKFYFEGCGWPKRGRRIVLNETLQKHLLPGSEEREEGINPEKELPSRLEHAGNVYRKLKEKYLAEHNHPEVSQWHYCEKEMDRQRKVKSLKQVIKNWDLKGVLSWFRITNIYYLCSGYGERPGKAAVVLGGLIVLLPILLNGFGVSPPGEVVKAIQGFSSQFDPERFWAVVTSALEYTFFVKSPEYQPYTTSGKICTLLLTRLLIPVQAALFAFALRNKFRR